MTIYELAEYVNLDVDDSFSEAEIARWFNKGISQYNLLQPLTTYPYVTIDEIDLDTNGIVDAYEEDYPLSDTFMLGIMLPFVNSAIRGQDSSLSEKQMYLQEFLTNARMFKSASNIPLTYMLDQKNTDLDIYQLGENVYLSDMTRAPYTADWGRASTFSEIAAGVTVVFRNQALTVLATSVYEYGATLANFITNANLADGVANITGTYYSDVALTNEIATTSYIYSDQIIYVA